MTNDDLRDFTMVAMKAGQLLTERRNLTERLAKLSHADGMCRWAEVMSITMESDDDRFYGSNGAIVGGLRSLHR